MTALEELAAMECPTCQGKGTHVEDHSLYGEPDPGEYQCPACNGTGALVPGLRKPCPGYFSSIRGQWLRCVGTTCAHCGGRTWLTVSEAEEFLAMVQWCIINHIEVDINPAGKGWDDILYPAYIQLEQWDKDAHESQCFDPVYSTDAQALATAIIEVVGK